MENICEICELKFLLSGHLLRGSRYKKISARLASLNSPSVGDVGKRGLRKLSSILLVKSRGDGSFRGKFMVEIIRSFGPT